MVIGTRDAYWADSSGGCDRTKPWNVYQGFTMSYILKVNTGDSDDYFGWGQTGDLSFTIMFKYING